MNDLKFALRQLLKNPGFTAVAVLTLALGIGANTAAFSWIQTVLLRTLPGVTDAGQLVVLVPRHVSGGVIDTMSYPEVQELAAHKELFAGIVASQYSPLTLTAGPEPEWVWGQMVTANFFDVLGVRPVLGRTFLPDEESRPGGHPVVVLSHGFWQRRFKGDPNIMGRTITLNRHAFTVVGVAAEGFRGTMGGLAFDLWVPVMMRGQLLEAGSEQTFFKMRGNRWLHTIARLAPGASPGRVEAALDTVARQWEQEFPVSNRNLRFAALPLWKSPWGAPGVLLPLLSVLFAVTLLVLLIVAANVANLLLARAQSREREIAVRMAIGASRGRVLRQFLTESLLLTLLGALAGVPCALGLMHCLRELFPISFLPVVLDPQLDASGLLFMMSAAVLTGLLFGLAPAWQATRGHPAATLKSGRGAGVARQRLRGMLVASEIALALLMLVGAGLCAQSFRHARTMNRGFDSDGVLLANLRLGDQGYRGEEGLIFFRTLLERLRALPGAEAVGLAGYVPLGPEGGASTRISVEGYLPQPTENMSFGFSVVTPGYFETIRMRLVEGRSFEARDDDNASRVVVVNEVLARRFWPGQSPLGRRMTVFGNREVTVIGVARGTKIRRLNEPATGFFYLPLEQSYSANMNVHLRTAGNPMSLADAVRREIRTLDPSIQPAIVVPMSEVTDFAVLTQRAAAAVLTVLGATALLLAMMGVYGVTAFTVAQRTQEIGIRMALGAGRGDVQKLILKHGARLAALGLAAGLIASMLTAPLLASLLVGVGVLDPMVFAGASALLLAVTLFAGWVPARRAASVDPMVALRSE